MSGQAAIEPETIGTAIGQEVEAIAERVTEDSRSEEEREDMPLPTEPRTIFLAGLFVLAVLAALYTASEIVLPVVLAIVLKLLLQPVVSVMDRLRVPRGIGALFALVLLIIGIVVLVGALAGPATSWAGKLPGVLPNLQEKLAIFKRPIASIQYFVQQVDNVTGPGGAPAAAPPEARASHAANIMGVLFSGTTTIVAGLFTTLIVLFYLLVSGETFLLRLVEILPRFGTKRQAVEISLHVQEHISAYLITVTLINAVVGLATLLIMWLCGVDDPLLWGVIAFVLNYVPILGPVVGVLLFGMAGVVSLGVTWSALLPAGLYFAVHVLEGEMFTPMLLARRFTINPVAVILALVFWYWMWGVPGAILAVPMLAIAKIVCDDIRPLRAFGHFLEG
jgi:predicted PurR-regulated permease PerM